MAVEKEDQSDDDIARIKALPLYRSHKLVRAARITDIQHAAEGTWLKFSQRESPYPLLMSAQFVERHQPEAGDYLVVYDNNYMSISPAEAFEAGYKPESEASQ